MFKKILDLYLKWLQNNGVLKLLASIVLCVIIYMINGKSNNPNLMYLYIIPGLYLVPFVITALVYAFIIWPISVIFKK